MRATCIRTRLLRIIAHEPVVRAAAHLLIGCSAGELAHELSYLEAEGIVAVDQRGWITLEAVPA